MVVIKNITNVYLLLKEKGYKGHFITFLVKCRISLISLGYYSYCYFLFFFILTGVVKVTDKTGGIVFIQKLRSLL